MRTAKMFGEFVLGQPEVFGAVSVIALLPLFVPLIILEAHLNALELTAGIVGEYVGEMSPRR